MLAITDGAAEALQLIRDNIEELPEEAGLRITPEEGEDGEPGWALEVVSNKQPDDIVVEGPPLPVFMPKETADELAQSALDGETHGDHVHFGIVDLSEDGQEQGDDDEGAGSDSDSGD